MSQNIFNKAIKELLPDIANAIFDEIKVPRVGAQHIRVSGFTRDVLEGIYLHLDKLLSNKNREAYKLCFIAERAGKTVPITPVERVMEYRTKPSIKALVVFDPWKIEEYSRHMFLHYSFSNFPMQRFLEDYALENMANAPTKVRNLFVKLRDLFTGNFPALERPLREALFSFKIANENFSFSSFGRNLIYFNAFPDAGLTEKNCGPRIEINARLSRLFIHSRIPMNERILLLNPKDKDSAVRLMTFFANKDGILPEFWLLEIHDKHQDLYFDKWSAPIAKQTRRHFVANFDGIGRDRRAGRELIITWEMPYGTVLYGSVSFRVWNREVVVAERVQRNNGDARFILDLEGVEPGQYQLQVVLLGTDSRIIADSWSAPFWWPGIIISGLELKREGMDKLHWLHGPVVNSVPEAMYSHIRDEPALKRKKSELMENSPKTIPIPFPQGDGVQEIILPDHMRYFLRTPEAFRVLEKAFLDDSKGLSRYSLDLTDEKPQLKAIELDPRDMPEEFVKLRRLLTMNLRRVNASPSSADLTSFSGVCTKYLLSYLEMLDKILKSRAKVIKDDFLFIDTVTLTAGDRVLGILTLPIHPIETAFLFGYQQMLVNAWQKIFKSKTSNVSDFPPEQAALRSRFINVITSQEGPGFSFVAAPHPGFGLFIAEGVRMSELWSRCNKFFGNNSSCLIETARKPMTEILAKIVSGRSVSIAATGIRDSDGIIHFCKLLAESLPDKKTVLDISFYGTPDGALDRAVREIERLKHRYCLYDLSSDPDFWLERFPFDRMHLRTASVRPARSS